MGKILSEVKRAYLAGLIDGDGAIMACIERHNEKRFRLRVRISVKITLSSKEEIEWIRKITGIGRIRNNRRTFEWIVRDKKDTEWILSMIKPYTHLKIRQARIALNILKHSFDDKDKKSLYKKALLADTLSSFNIRSKNRRKNFATMIKESISRND
ncbi:hypothetical protein COY65_02825 [Candidatus Jorgensenbacteria bacterium CG_4_10_14_0_8_um_filter_39_13]|uniref:Homing endonuclease LAGLIDADG domain-containing protein n=1 Tax=Candidatus Jorgensenbacteria bacterium CG_4_10_14_0_8_um_filter_39_13 TaxID=1974589 RepID=A0A2M7RFW4_9BACT|nr:MAG: hypothetical protein COS46_00170 [Candidatus Jorgensenbacteria bacterium CG03_land_8_20_14_0_80_38_39]PIY95628.1 MAG: hypothetical protein COY65_02825 [Candidatus Jorgensenbacteria bacterium CG_4_10_14_0_8_um_filter_39_13]PJA94991.1 MAG: hypothetical protein CO130_01535 [Candidatus Jorgensenbacteria bacterium CG_4_9_14_3_um_filter_38_10]